MRIYTFTRIIHYFFLLLSRLPMPGHKRHYILRYAGLTLPPPQCNSKIMIYIGSGVHFDTLAPERITIGNHVFITSGTRILTHYYNPTTQAFTLGNVTIGSNVFIGLNVVICKPITIGDGAVVGAGSVVTKDIPPNELWAGCPTNWEGHRI